MKVDNDGNNQVYKARLPAKGFKQGHGIDYDETFSPIAMLKSIRILLVIDAFYDYANLQMDVKSFFMNGFLKEDVHMTQHEGIVDPENPIRVCKLQKSIYGLKQAFQSWNLCFDETIKQFSFLKNGE